MNCSRIDEQTNGHDEANIRCSTFYENALKAANGHTVDSKFYAALRKAWAC